MASQTRRGDARGLVAVNHAYIWSNKRYFVDMFINYTQITAHKQLLAPNTNLTTDFHDHRPLVCANPPHTDVSPLSRKRLSLRYVGNNNQKRANQR